MNDLETRLEHALRVDAPAPRDPMFRIEVLMRRERAAFRRRLLTGGAVALGAAILASLGLGVVGELAGADAERLAAVAAAGVVMAGFLAPHVAAPSVTSALRARFRSPFSGR